MKRNKWIPLHFNFLLCAATLLHLPHVWVYFKTSGSTQPHHKLPVCYKCGWNKSSIGAYGTSSPRLIFWFNPLKTSWFLRHTHTSWRVNFDMSSFLVFSHVLQPYMCSSLSQSSTSLVFWGVSFCVGLQAWNQAWFPCVCVGRSRKANWCLLPCAVSPRWEGPTRGGAADTWCVSYCCAVWLKSSYSPRETNCNLAGGGVRVSRTNNSWSCESHSALGSPTLSLSSCPSHFIFTLAQCADSFQSSHLFSLGELAGRVRAEGRSLSGLERLESNKFIQK